jgi:hypothetical protein
MTTFITQEYTKKVYVSYNDRTHIIDWGERVPKIYNWTIECCQNVGELIIVSYIKNDFVYERSIWINQSLPVLVDEEQIFKIELAYPIAVKHLPHLGTIVINSHSVQHKDRFAEIDGEVIYWDHGYLITKNNIRGFNIKNIKFISASWNSKSLKVVGKNQGKLITIEIDHKNKSIISITELTKIY